jgi:type I restriction enzyme M protein
MLLTAREAMTLAHGAALACRFVLTPGRYVGVGVSEEEGEPFEDKIGCLTTALRKHLDESERLDETIREALGAMRYGG